MSKLIYILSVGHSGSTLLDLLIGSLEKSFSTGELQRLPWTLNNRDLPEVSLQKENVCSCLSEIRKCPVWQKVLSNLEKRVGMKIIEEPYNLKTGLLSNPKNDKSFGINVYLKMLRNVYVTSKIRRVNNISFFFEKLLASRIKVNWHLIDAIGEELKVDYVIDSSKRFERYLLLKSRRPNDIYLVVNRRNHYGHAYSYYKKGKNYVKSTKNMIRQYDRIFSYIDQNKIDFIEVEYEKLCEDPHQMLKKIKNFIGSSEPDGEIDIDTTMNHIIAGNPIRYSGKLKIKYDDKWVSNFPKKDKLIVDKLSARYSR